MSLIAYRLRMFIYSISTSKTLGNKIRMVNRKWNLTKALS